MNYIMPCVTYGVHMWTGTVRKMGFIGVTSEQRLLPELEALDTYLLDVHAYNFFSHYSCDHWDQHRLRFQQKCQLSELLGPEF
jgi:hypothetical protein